MDLIRYNDKQSKNLQNYSFLRKQIVNKNGDFINWGSAVKMMEFIHVLFLHYLLAMSHKIFTLVWQYQQQAVDRFGKLIPYL